MDCCLGRELAGLTDSMSAGRNVNYESLKPKSPHIVRDGLLLRPAAGLRSPASSFASDRARGSTGHRGHIEGEVLCGAAASAGSQVDVEG